MADISAFPAIKNVIDRGTNILSYTAGAAIKAGQVVAINATDMTVQPAVTGTTNAVVGVAMYGVASGALVAVAGPGCIVYVVNGKDGTNIAAGKVVKAYGTTTAGTVVEQALTGGVAPDYVVGVLLEGIVATSAGAFGRCLITLGMITPAA